MNDIFIILAIFLSLIGGLVTLIIRPVFDKLICLGILVSGTILFMIEKGYVDVAIAVSLMMPIGTIFILLLLGKKQIITGDNQ